MTAVPLEEDSASAPSNSTTIRPRSAADTDLARDGSDTALKPRGGRANPRPGNDSSALSPASTDDLSAPAERSA